MLNNLGRRSDAAQEQTLSNCPYIHNFPGKYHVNGVTEVIFVHLKNYWQQM